MKFLFIVMFELRALQKTIDKLYHYIVDFYDADIFICAQKSTPQNDKNIDLFQRKVVFKKLYDKPDPKIYFKNKKFKIGSGDSWNNPSNLQIYINYQEVAQEIEPFIDSYDYFIILRTDSDILFPFPSRELITTIPHGIYSFDPLYSRIYGGGQTPFLTHKNFIKDYLKVYSNVLNNNFLVEHILTQFNLNQEKFLNLCCAIKGLSYIKFIKNLNFYWTADKLQDKTTWSNIQYDPELFIIYKYKGQMEVRGSLNKTIMFLLPLM
jgi:hypothetical protein